MAFFSRASALDVGGICAAFGKYERDEMKPSIETAKKLADALEVSLDYLVGDAELKVLDKKNRNAFRILRSSPKMNGK